MQQVAEDLKISGLVDSCVLADFLEIGKRTPLSHLMSDDGRLVGNGVTVVAWESQLVREVIDRLRRFPVPVESAGSSFHVEFGACIPLPSATDTGDAVNA